MTEFAAAPVASRKSLMERLEDALLPLINLVFLLLMFFIVAGQMQNRALPALPGTATDQTSQESEADLVVLASGEWQIRGDTVNRDTLASRLPAATNQASLLVAAEASTSMADLERLFSLLADAGYQDFVLLTEPSAR